MTKKTRRLWRRYRSRSAAKWNQLTSEHDILSYHRIMCKQSIICRVTQSNEKKPAPKKSLPQSQEVKRTVCHLRLCINLQSNHLTEKLVGASRKWWYRALIGCGHGAQSIFKNYTRNEIIERSSSEVKLKNGQKIWKQSRFGRPLVYT